MDVKTELALALAHVEREHDLSGSILVSQDGDVLFAKAYGYASRQLSVRNTLQTKFHIASMTKMFIAMVALRLSEQGQISLDAHPATYMPELVVLDRDVTLHHLLSHTSGLQDIYGVENLVFAMHKLKVEQGNLLSYLVTLPPLFRPGERWSYSSTGYILMGYLMERVTGLSFDELLHREVLTPLSMTASGLDYPRRINPGRASGHTTEHGQVFNAENDHLSLFEEAPGELYSTVLDLKQWCDAMFDCPLVAPSTLRCMFTPYAQVDPSLHYGYGWYLGPIARWHGGETPGFFALLRQYPTRRASIIVLFNSDHMQARPVVRAIEPLLLM